MAWHAEDGVQVGTYLIHYADGQRKEVIIIYGEDAPGWWGGAVKKPLARATVAWTRTNAFDAAIRLFKTVWENPLPQVEIKSLDFVSKMTDAGPFVIAITAE